MTATDRLVRVALVLSALTTTGLVLALLALVRHGVELTDEGYYLVSMALPSLYPATASQFGFLLHPLHELAAGNVVLLRAANVLLTFGLTTGMLVALLRTDAS